MSIVSVLIGGIPFRITESRILIYGLQVYRVQDTKLAPGLQSQAVSILDSVILELVSILESVILEPG